MISITGRTGRGFTLVEMLVVLAIIGMMLGISIPFVSGFGRGLRLGTSARAVMGALQLARSNAITYRKDYSVVFDVENNQYWIEDSGGRIYEKKKTLPRSVKFYDPGGKEDEAQDPVTFDGDRVVFRPTGSIYGQSGHIVLSDRQGKSKRISIIASTGKITVE